MDTFPASDPPSWTLGLEHDKASMKVMQVQAYGGPEQLHYEDVPIPKLSPGEILVAVQAASVNPIDCKLASGDLRPVMKNKAVALPWIPGGDFSGVVEKVAENVDDLKEGDEIYGSSPTGGGYAQFVVVQATSVALKPKKLSHFEAASIPLAGQTAWQALFTHGHLDKGKNVLIHGGAGGVGSFAIQLARWKGAKVFATGASNHKDYLQRLGAHMAIDYQTTAFEKIVRDADLVVDLIGGETQQRSFKVLKAGGTLVSTISLPSQEEADKYKVHATMMSMRPSREQLKRLADLLDSGEIRTNVSKVYPLYRAKEAWGDILSHHTQGKIVLQVA
jgi:NADPH:quinone reductase-like Zn-dependent oxidoreductase